MADIKNNHSTALNVGGVAIQAGKTAKVVKWDSAKLGNGVKAWLKAGILEVVGGDTPTVAVPKMPAIPEIPGLPPAVPTNDEDAEKERIIAELHDLGVDKTKRTSLENLRTALDEAKASRT